MIACKYCGRENEPARTHCHECGTELPSPPSPSPPRTPPPLPAPKLITPEALEAAFGFKDGFHRADWDFVQRWIDSNINPEDSTEAWNEVALLWVNKLRGDLGGDYFVLRSAHTVLLCDRPVETATWLLDYAGHTADTIAGHLGRTAWGGWTGHNVILVFSDEDDFYQYLAFHSPDGEQAKSGGVCIHSDYTHIAFPWYDEAEAANTIVHELTHECLAHLPLPLWLNEGIAVTMQKAVAPPARPLGQSGQDALYAATINWHAPVMWDELAQQHFAFWTEANIQTLWAGTSFYQPGEPNQLSYSLAEVLVKLLAGRGDGVAFHTFLESARQGDAGQTAAMNHLGADLGEIAGTFLGDGNWRPQRKAMIACWESAGWEKQGDAGADTPAEERAGDSA